MLSPIFLVNPSGALSLALARSACRSKATQPRPQGPSLSRAEHMSAAEEKVIRMSAAEMLLLMPLSLAFAERIEQISQILR